MQKIIWRLVIILSIIAVSVIVIGYGRGYRIDTKNKTLSPTGIISVSSYPTAAKIYINGELKGVSNTNLTLNPGKYKVEIKKDGYTTWAKDINLKGELVISLDVLLFPLNASLSPQTNLGITKAIPVDQTGKVVVFSENSDPEKAGIYLFDSTSKPLSFFPPSKLLLLKKNLENYGDLDFKTAKIYFSPDYKEGIFEFQKTISKEDISISNNINETTLSFLLSLDEENKSVFEVTASKDTLLSAWQKETDQNNQKILETFPKSFAKIASDSFKIISLSPDETRILYQSNDNTQIPVIITPPVIAANQTTEEREIKKNNFYVYDKKEDKNFPLNLAKDTDIQWYPDSEHLIFVSDKKIIASDYDGTNQQIVYSTTFDPSFFTTTNDGKIIILTNLNPEANQYGDLYLVGIR